MSTAPPAFIRAADYGMDPARTDSTNATSLNTAIAAAQAQGGGVVVIPPGTYTITGTIIIAASGITLQGANQHASVLQFNNGSSDCLVVGGQPSSVYGVLISQVTLKGEGKTGGDLLHATNVSNMTVRDVTMSDGYNGFYHEISNNVLLNNVNINLSQPGGSYGIKWYSAASESTPSHVTTLDSVIVNCNLTGADGMIIDGYCHTLRINAWASCEAIMVCIYRIPRTATPTSPSSCSAMTWKLTACRPRRCGSKPADSSISTIRISSITAPKVAAIRTASISRPMAPRR